MSSFSFGVLHRQINQAICCFPQKNKALRRRSEIFWGYSDEPQNEHFFNRSVHWWCFGWSHTCTSFNTTLLTTNIFKNNVLFTAPEEKEETDPKLESVPTDEHHTMGLPYYAHSHLKHQILKAWGFSPKKVQTSTQHKMKNVRRHNSNKHFLPVRLLSRGEQV